jgi:hypothetical protein
MGWLSVWVWPNRRAAATALQDNPSPVRSPKQSWFAKEALQFSCLVDQCEVQEDIIVLELDLFFFSVLLFTRRHVGPIAAKPDRKPLPASFAFSSNQGREKGQVPSAYGHSNH